MHYYQTIICICSGYNFRRRTILIREQLLFLIFFKVLQGRVMKDAEYKVYSSMYS
jgi:hypothetical protein